MASQSALRARVATIRELLAPDTSKQPCASVYINRQVEGPLLLTAGEEHTAETQSPAAHNCGDGHVCGPHCVVVSINFAPRGDGERPQTPVDASAPPTVPTGQSDAQRAPAGVYGDGGAVGNAVPDPPASEATVEMRRIWRPPRPLPPGLDEAREPACASPVCGHLARHHSVIQREQQCAWCGFGPIQHWMGPVRDPSVSLPGKARLLMPCLIYTQQYSGPAAVLDTCDGDGCRCPGFRQPRQPVVEQPPSDFDPWTEEARRKP